MQRTYAMIKPDVVKAGKVEKMQAEIEAAGFKIIKQKTVKLTTEKVLCTHYPTSRKLCLFLVLKTKDSTPYAISSLHIDAISAWLNLDA